MFSKCHPVLKTSCYNPVSNNQDFSVYKFVVSAHFAYTYAIVSNLSGRKRILILTSKYLMEPRLTDKNPHIQIRDPRSVILPSVLVSSTICVAKNPRRVYVIWNKNLFITVHKFVILSKIIKTGNYENTEVTVLWSANGLKIIIRNVFLKNDICIL